MQYIMAQYSNDVFCDIGSSIVEILMWLMLCAMIVLLIIYASIRIPWKKAYILVYLSMYLSSGLYVILFFTVRIYISIPSIIAFFVLFYFVEKKELNEIAKKYNVSRDKLNTSNKYIIVILTIFITVVILFYLYCNGTSYLL
jgi:hypothetical protein